MDLSFCLYPSNKNLHFALRRHSTSMKGICSYWDAYFSFTFFLTLPDTVIESWMDVIMICCQSLGPDQTDEGVCMPSQLLLAMNGSWLTRVASLSNRPYLLCISDAGSPWITVLARNTITIFHLHTHHLDSWTREEKPWKGKQRNRVELCNVGICIHKFVYVDYLLKFTHRN